MVSLHDLGLSQDNPFYLLGCAFDKFLSLVTHEARGVSNHHYALEHRREINISIPEFTDYNINRAKRDYEDELVSIADDCNYCCGALRQPPQEVVDLLASLSFTDFPFMFRHAKDVYDAEAILIKTRNRVEAKWRAIAKRYQGLIDADAIQPQPKPNAGPKPKNTERDTEIVKRYNSGETVAKIISAMITRYEDINNNIVNSVLNRNGVKRGKKRSD